MSAEGAIRALVVDPTREIAERIAAALGDAGETGRVAVARVADVAAAAAGMSRREADVVLLPLPGPEGTVRGMVELRTGAPDAPVVVLTSAADEPLALKAVQLGATDHLVTERLYGTLLVRCLRHAVEVEKVRARLRAYEAEWPPALAAEPAGPEGRAATLQTALPRDFAELAETYGRLLDRSVEHTLGEAGAGPDPETRGLARRAGELRAGPKDLVEIHAAAMTVRERRVGALRMQLYVAEGRVRLLELMGHLVSYYRDSLPGAGSVDAGPAPDRGRDTETDTEATDER